MVRKGRNLCESSEADCVVDSSTGSKSRPLDLEIVSLIEFFTEPQIEEHVSNLRQWSAMVRSKQSEDTPKKLCSLCELGELKLKPIPVFCTKCNARVEECTSYTKKKAGTQCIVCTKCYNATSKSLKEKFTKIQNDEPAYEQWVCCDKCSKWQHHICALFNNKRNKGGKVPYMCAMCCAGQIRLGLRTPLPVSLCSSAKDILTCELSDYLEKRLARRLNAEREPGQVSIGEGLVVRVVCSVDQVLKVKEQFFESLKDLNFPVAFPYKSKVVLLFQKIEGVDVCLFGMYLQEYGSDCPYPNQRRVYLAYFFSLNLFRHDRKTATGEALRTIVYHEILIGYLQYCKDRGFTSCNIWACPPLKGDDYILYRYPETQKRPQSQKLLKWCNHKEDSLDASDKHCFNSSPEHVIYLDNISYVRDAIRRSEIFDRRENFLDFCHQNHYQFNDLRNAKYFTMMLLYHLHRPLSYVLLTTCDASCSYIDAVEGKECVLCPILDVCDACFRKEDGIAAHCPHNLANIPSGSPPPNELQVKKCLDAVEHACQCDCSPCQFAGCDKAKSLLVHAMHCEIKVKGNCRPCLKLWYLLQRHAEECKQESNCHVAGCRKVKKTARKIKEHVQELKVNVRFSGT